MHNRTLATALAAVATLALITPAVAHNRHAEFDHVGSYNVIATAGGLEIGRFDSVHTEIARFSPRGRAVLIGTSFSTPAMEQWWQSVQAGTDSAVTLTLRLEEPSGAVFATIQLIEARLAGWEKVTANRGSGPATEHLVFTFADASPLP